MLLSSFRVQPLFRLHFYMRSTDSMLHRLHKLLSPSTKSVCHRATNFPMKTAQFVTNRRHFNIFDRKAIRPMRRPSDERLLINLLDFLEVQSDPPFQKPLNRKYLAEILSMWTRTRQRRRKKKKRKLITNIGPFRMMAFLPTFLCDGAHKALMTHQWKTNMYQ